MTFALPTLAIARREFASMFRVPLGWVVIALFVCLSGLFFVSRSIVPGAPASMRDFFSVWWGLVLIVAPAISMRLVSEETRTGTIEMTQTAPVTDASVILGKYLAAVGFFVTMLVPTFSAVIVLELLARPDYGPIVSGYLGLLLLGMLYLAVGTLASVLTSSQTLAFLGTLFMLIALDVVTARLAGMIGTGSRFVWAQRLLFALSPSAQASDFYRGLIDTSRVVFFLAASAWFLMLATLVLQSRRWR